MFEYLIIGMLISGIFLYYVSQAQETYEPEVLLIGFAILFIFCLLAWPAVVMYVIYFNLVKKKAKTGTRD